MKNIGEMVLMAEITFYPPLYFLCGGEGFVSERAVLSAGMMNKRDPHSACMCVSVSLYVYIAYM